MKGKKGKGRKKRERKRGKEKKKKKKVPPPSNSTSTKPQAYLPAYLSGSASLLTQFAQIQRAPALIKAGPHGTRRAPAPLPPGFAGILGRQPRSPCNKVEDVGQRDNAGEPATHPGARDTPENGCSRGREGRRAREDRAMVVVRQRSCWGRDSNRVRKGGSRGSTRRRARRLHHPHPANPA